MWITTYLIISTNLKDRYEKDVFGGIVVTNKALVGNLNITAHYVGGDFSDFKDGLIPSITTDDSTGYTYLYDDILDKPTEFPVTSHKVHTSELTTGFDDVTTALWAINDSIVALGGLPPTIDIPQVNGLQDILDRNITNNRYNKLALGELVTAVPDGSNYIHITLELPTTDTDLSVVIDCVHGIDGHYRVHVSGGVIASPVALSGDYSNPITNAQQRLENTNRLRTVYTAINTDGIHIFIGSLGNTSGENLSVYLSHCVYTLGIDKEALVYNQPVGLILINDPAGNPIGSIPGYSGVTPVSTKYADNTHKHEMSDINGLSEEFDNLTFTTPYIYVDDPAAIPTIKALSGYIFDCENKTYTIDTPEKTRFDKDLIDGDFFSVQIKTTANESFFVLLTPRTNELIMGSSLPFGLNNNYSTTTFTLCTIDGQKDWRITSVVGEVDTKGYVEEELVGRSITPQLMSLPTKDELRSSVTIENNKVTEHLSVGFSEVKLRSTGVLRYIFSEENSDYATLIPEFTISSGIPGKQTKVEELVRTSTYMDFQFTVDGLYTPKRVSVIIR